MANNSKAAATPHKSQYGVIVICESEADQKVKFEALKKRKWKLKVVSV